MTPARALALLVLLAACGADGPPRPPGQDAAAQDAAGTADAAAQDTTL